MRRVTVDIDAGRGATTVGGFVGGGFVGFAGGAGGVCKERTLLKRKEGRKGRHERCQGRGEDVAPADCKNSVCGKEGVGEACS